MGAESSGTFPGGSWRLYPMKDGGFMLHVRVGIDRYKKARLPRDEPEVATAKGRETFCAEAAPIIYADYHREQAVAPHIHRHRILHRVPYHQVEDCEPRSWTGVRLRIAKEKDIVGHLLKEARRRAAKRGLEYMIGRDDLKYDGFCPVFGWRFQIGPRGPAMPTLDRIDSSRGYVPGNVMIISWRANLLKSNASLSEMENVLRYMRRELA